MTLKNGAIAAKNYHMKKLNFTLIKFENSHFIL